MSTEANGRKRYIMQELLAQCDPNAPRTAEEQEWLDAPPVGREFGGWRCVGISRLHRELKSILRRGESVVITHRGMPVASLSEGRLLTDDDAEASAGRRDTEAEILQAIREIKSVSITQMNEVLRTRGASAGVLSHIKGDPRWSDDESIQDEIDRKHIGAAPKDEEDPRQ